MPDGSVERIHLSAQARHDQRERDRQPHRIGLIQAFDPQEKSCRDCDNADDASDQNIGLVQEMHVNAFMIVGDILPQLVSSGNEPEGFSRFGLKRVP